MNVSEEQLRAVDEELASLGKDSEAVASLLSRFADREPLDLDSVDGELEELAAALDDAEALLAAARARVPSALVESPAAEPFGDEREEEDDFEMFSEPPPPMDDGEDVAESEAEPEPEAEAEAEAEAEPEPEPEAEAKAKAEPEAVSEAEAQFFGDDDPAAEVQRPSSSPEAAFFGDDSEFEGEAALSEDDLFGEAGEADEAAGGDLSDLFDSDELAAAGAEPIADIESAPSVSDIEHDLFDDGEPESTHIFTVDDVAKIERQSKAPEAADRSEDEIQADSEIDAMLAANDAEIAAMTAESADEDLDALLAGAEAGSSLLEGDLTRSEPPPQNPAAAEEAEAAIFEEEDDDFELMIDDVDMLEMDGDDFTEFEGDATIVAESPIEAAEGAEAAEAAPPEEEAEPEEEKKGGFFKKLFGGD